MLKIRLLRTGRRNHALYRMVVTDARVKRQGQCLENVGTYDPAGTDEKKLNLKMDRIKHWVGLGAQPTESATNLLKRNGFNVRAEAEAAHAARKRKEAAKPAPAKAAPAKAKAK